MFNWIKQKYKHAINVDKGVSFLGKSFILQ